MGVLHPPIQLIYIAFHENFLHEILTSYWFAEVFSLEYFPLCGTTMVQEFE